MANLAKSLREMEAFYGEPIEAIVVGPHDRAPYNARPAPDENVVLSRDAGLAKLDVDYDDGYGSADCYPFWAWTASRVFFVGEYDGATGVVYAPRQPGVVEPEFSGRDPCMDSIVRVAEARRTA